jgi:capsid protein
VADNVAIPSNLTTVWTPPRREMIDPVKETEAMKSSVRAGFDSLSESVRQLGKDPKEHFSEMQKDFNMLDKLGLVLDSDPRKDAKAQSNSPIQEDLTGSKAD